MPFRCARPVVGVLFVVLATACTSPTAPPVPSPTGTPAAYACPPGDLLIETGPSDHALFAAQAVEYSAACENRARLTVTSARDAGTTSFVNGLVHIAAADLPLDADQQQQAEVRCLQHPAWHLPVTADPVALIHRVDGVPELTLRPTTLARIFSGTITRWDDPDIAADNPDTDLPDARIEVFFRGGQTGVTRALSDYLNRVAPEAWPAAGTPAWRGAGQARGSADEVFDAVRSTAYSIGYVERSSMPRSVASPTPTSATPTPIQSPGTASPTATPAPDEPVTPRLIRLQREGGSVALTAETAQQGVTDLRLPAEGNNLVAGVEETTGWPITRVTYQILCSAGQRADLAPLERDWVSYLVADPTQEAIADTGRPTLSPAVRDRVRAAAQDLA